MSTPLDIKLIPQALEAALIKTFLVQLKLNLKVSIKAGSVELLQAQKADCLTTITLDSSKFVGSISLAFPAPVLLKIIESMLGEQYPELTAENSDAAGELLNIIYATARKPVNEGGFDFGMALPSTVIGENLSLTKSHFTGTALLFECTCEVGQFMAALSLKKK